MAHICPDTAPSSLPPTVNRVFQALKRLPDTYFIWHHLAPWQPDAPDFLLITHAGQVLLIKVSSAAAAQAQNAAQLLLIEDDRQPLGSAEGQVLAQFVRSIQLPDNSPLHTLVVFPNIPHKQVLASRASQAPGEPQWAGNDLLKADGGLDWEHFLPTQAMEPLCIEKLRQAFTPEVRVPAEMTVRPSNPRRLEAGLTDYLLDYNQEQAVKADLDLAAEGQALMDDFRLNIINGVAGSGKTLILLYRLRLLYHLYPDKRYLVLTHNRPLIHDMQHRFHLLEGKLPETIEWRTFNGWCYQHWPATPRWVEPIKLRPRRQLIQNAWQQHLQKTAITERMLMSEIDWIKDQLPMSAEDYLKADRKGRGFRLTLEQRQRLLLAKDAYQQALQQQGSLDWGDIPQRLWQYHQEGRVQFPQYDMILVDEAQFFAPLWVAILQKLFAGQNHHLFMVADPTQGFLGRGASWKSLGLEARGRTHTLRRSYRTTREIMNCATLFYRLRMPDERDEDILTPDLFNMPNGAFPEIIALSSPQDEIARVANEVEALAKQNYPRKYLLILHANGQGVRLLKDAIDHRLGKNAAMDPKDTYPGNYVRVTTLNAGAGLESPIVFLVGLRELFEEEQSLRLSDDEREGLILENTRKIYMAATRAGQRLVLTYVGDLPAVLKQAFLSN